MISIHTLTANLPRSSVTVSFFQYHSHDCFPWLAGCFLLLIPSDIISHNCIAYIYNQFMEKPVMLHFGLVMCCVGWYPLQSPEKCPQIAYLFYKLSQLLLLCTVNKKLQYFQLTVKRNDQLIPKIYRTRQRYTSRQLPIMTGLPIMEFKII